MPIAKQLVYDATTPANGDTLGSYLLTALGAVTSVSLLSGASIALDTRAFVTDAAGVGLTSTLASGKQALDVNIANETFTGMFDVEGNVADGAADSGKPVKIGFQALGASPSAAASGNRVNGTSDLYRRQFVNTAPDIAVSNGVASITTTASVIATAIAGRRHLILQNNGSAPVYIGGSSVTADQATTGGVVITAHGGFAEFDVGEHIALYAIAGSGTQKVSFLQLA